MRRLPSQTSLDDDFGGSIVAQFTRRFALVAAATATAVVGSLGLVAGSAAAAPLAAPTGLAPDNSAQDIADPATWQKDPVLTWSTVAGADGYDVQLSNSDDFTDSTNLWTLPNSGHVPGASLALPQPLDHGAYYWRVRATAGTVLGTWSTAAELYRGWDAAPVASTVPVTGDNRVDWTANPNGILTAPWRFSWTPIPDASSYEIEFSVDPTFPADAQDPTQQHGKWNDGAKTLDCLTTHTTFTPYSSVANKDIGVDDCSFASFNPTNLSPIYWRVRGVDDSEAGVPAGPQGQPLDCFGTPQEITAQPPNSSASTASALGTPASPSHECSLWSATEQATIPSADTTPNENTFGPLTANANNCTLTTAGTASTPRTYSCTDTPEISWAPVSDAGGKFALAYQVTIADDPGFTNIERIYQTQFLSLTPRDDLRDFTSGRGYYVAVQACGSTAGNCTSESVFTFTKRTPRIAGISAEHLNGAERFTWQDLAGKYATTNGVPSLEAESYILQLADASDPDFANPVLNLTLDRSCDTSSSATCYNKTGDAAGDAQAVVHVADGAYLWRVIPVDRAGNHLPAAVADLSSNPLRVTVDTTPPQLQLTTRNGVAVNGSLTMTSTEPVTGVGDSQVQLVAVAGGAVVPVHVTAAAAPNTWTLAPTRKLVVGQQYALQLTTVGGIQDLAHNNAVVVGTPVRTTTIADDRSVAWTWPSGWTRVASSNAIGGTFEKAAAGKSVSLAIAGSKAYVYGCKGPSFGSLVVKVDGVTKATVSERQSFTKCGLLLWSGPITTSAQHVLSLTASGGAAAVDEVKVD